MSDAPDTARAERVLDYVARNIVDNPDDVSVSTDTDRSKPRVEVSVNQADMGRVIGKRGRVANAIRAVGRAAAATDGADVDVEFPD